VSLNTNTRVSIGLIVAVLGLAAGYHAWLTNGINARLDRVESKVDQLLLAHHGHWAEIAPQDGTPSLARRASVGAQDATASAH